MSGVLVVLGLVSWKATADFRATRPATTGRTFDPREARTLGLRTEELQARLRQAPEDFVAWSRLGLAYLDEARRTGNPALYAQAEGAFAKSLELEPADNYAALAERGALQNARHDFAGALVWAQRAAALFPKSPEVLAVKGDALLELGRYEEAFEVYQQLVDLAPGLASYSRAAYALELQGDVEGARRVLELALADVRAPRSRAFALSALGELAWSVGALDEAEAWYGQAVALDPESVLPRAGLARLDGARGQTEDALIRWREVVAHSPVPEYVAELGTVLEMTGRGDEARDQYALLEAQRRLLVANGVNGDLELALSSAERGIDLPAGLAAAQAEWGRRKSIHAADALAWQLHANGRDGEALELANQALRLGTRNASFLFHRGVIRSGLGDVVGSRADLEAARATNANVSLRHRAGLEAALAAPAGAR